MSDPDQAMCEFDMLKVSTHIMHGDTISGMRVKELTTSAHLYHHTISAERYTSPTLPNFLWVNKSMQR